MADKTEMKQMNQRSSNSWCRCRAEVDSSSFLAGSTTFKRVICAQFMYISDV